TMTVNKEVMKQATKQDFSNATELADYLAKKGMPFREAHEVVGKLVYTCIEKGIYLSDMPFGDFQQASALFEEDIYTVLD
ncbi:argininosuccinate lyase, partial [Pseudomonas sp. GW456-E7]